MIDFRAVEGAGAFWFLRHGKSEANDSGAMQGRQDSPLSEAGRRQARAAARWLAETPLAQTPGEEASRRPPFQRILSSPLSRARATADILAAELGGPPVEVREELQELDIGLFTGLTAEQAQERHPREWARFQEESWEGVPGAERIDALLERAERLWSHLLALRQETGGGAILSVTHSGIFQWIVKATLEQRRWMPIFPMGNCAVSLFRILNQRREGRAGYYWEWALINRPTLPEPRPPGPRSR